MSEHVLTDCGPDGGCEECDVCRYLNFLEWARSVAPSGSVIERKPEIEAYLRRTYPHAFPPPIPQTVSQEVREAAADLAASLGFGVFGAMIRDGSENNHRLVQRVARFEADCAARFVEKVEGLKRATSATQNTGRYYLDCAHNSAIDEAITAIQEPRP